MAERPALSQLRSLRRYSRHLLIPEVALAGQERLANARVLVVGAGGLGSPALEYLAAAGVGRIGIADDDTVDETNLQRQTLFATDDIGKKKTAVARDRLLAVNPLITVDAIPLRIDATNVRDIVKLYDVVLDCTDRFETRYLINDACFFENKPDVYASIYRFDAQITVFQRNGPCYRCLYPEAPPAGTVPTCAEGGVLGVLAGIAGSWQANEAIKFILGIGEPLVGRMLLIDALNAHTREIRYARDPACALCGNTPRITEIQPSNYQFESEADQAETIDEIDAEQLDEFLKRATLLDVREPHEIVLGIFDGAIHIPASQLEARLHQLDTGKTYIVACRVGVKSRWAVQRLHEAGFRRLRHLRGGLLTYATHRESFPIF